MGLPRFHFTFAAALGASMIKLALVEEMNFQHKNVKVFCFNMQDENIQFFTMPPKRAL